MQYFQLLFLYNEFKVMCNNTKFIICFTLLFQCVHQKLRSCAHVIFLWVALLSSVELFLSFSVICEAEKPELGIKPSIRIQYRYRAAGGCLGTPSQRQWIQKDGQEMELTEILWNVNQNCSYRKPLASFVDGEGDVNDTSQFMHTSIILQKQW